MEKGKKYKIWYKDDTGQVRARLVSVIEHTDTLLSYVNIKTNREEGIRSDWLQRFERMDNGDGNYDEQKKI